MFIIDENALKGKIEVIKGDVKALKVGKAFTRNKEAVERR